MGLDKKDHLVYVPWIWFCATSQLVHVCDLHMSDSWCEFESWGLLKYGVGDAIRTNGKADLEIRKERRVGLYYQQSFERCEVRSAKCEPRTAGLQCVPLE